MEKVFVHPECPFSENTFNLLTEFYELHKLNFFLAKDFYREHKKDFLKYVEEPVKYILIQVEEQLPDFIKKYMHIKQESCRGSWALKREKYLESAVVYSVEYCGIIPEDSSQLMLRVENQTLTFGWEAQDFPFEYMLYHYKASYRNDVNLSPIFKRYHLSSKHDFDLKYSVKEGDNNNLGWERVYRRIKPGKCIHELLETLLKDIPVDSLGLESDTSQKSSFGNIFVGTSLELKEILGYSAKQLIHTIAQTFKKVFPLFLLSDIDYMDRELPLLLNQYISVYEKEFNPVYHLEEISEITGFQTTQLTQWIHAINRKGQTIIQGPPGTGKTFIAEKLAKHLIGGGDGFSDIIQFHPAYTYEDFIEGLRPITQNGQLTYSRVPGRFLEFCEQAEACEDTCVLIIDEINRANLSQVFGELMYLLDDRDRTVKLASGKLFRIPKNVRLIGTMNTADRSIALVDNALRRRFAFIPVYPNYEVLRQYHQRDKTDFPVNKLISILTKVNQEINNKHYQLGISFFLTKTLAEDIQDIWQMEIEPYLEEYFFDDPAKMDEFLWDKIKYQFSN